jgi:hypothetical protein
MTGPKRPRKHWLDDHAPMADYVNDDSPWDGMWLSPDEHESMSDPSDEDVAELMDWHEGHDW